MKHPMLMGALVAGGVATLLCLVAMATTGWATYKSIAVGLFSVCGNKCVSYSATGAIAATKAFIVIGWLCIVAAIIVALIYFCKYAKNDVANMNLPLVAAIFFFIAGGTTMLGDIIFGTAGLQQIKDEVGGDFSGGYSFALSIIGALVGLACGSLMIVHRRRIGGSLA